MRLILIGLLTCVMTATPAGAILIRSDRDDAEYVELASKYASAVSLGAAGGEAFSSRRAGSSPPRIVPRRSRR